MTDAKKYLSTAISAEDTILQWELSLRKQRAQSLRFTHKLPSDWPEQLPRLPANSMEELDQFEWCIGQEKLFQYAAKYLGSFGRGDMAEVTRRTLERLMTNRLAEAFNWAGRPPKRAFKVLRSKDLIVCAVRLNLVNVTVPESSIEEVVKCWLKYAAWRR